MTAAHGLERTSRRLRVLLVEDNPGDAQLIREHVTGDPIWPVTVEWVPTLREAERRLAEGGYDLVLLDLGLPDSFGVETLVRVLEVAPSVPVTVLTGQVDGELAATCIETGAQDYLAKEWINRSLVLNVWNAALRAGVEADLVAARGSLSHVLEQSPDGVVVTGDGGVVRFANSAAARLFEGRLAVGHPFPVVDLGGTRDFLVPHADGSVSVVDARAGRIVWEGELATVITLRDVTGRVRAQDRIEHLNRVLKAIRTVNQLIVQEKDPERLIRRIVGELVDAGGYRGAWIALCGDDGSCVDAAEAGFGDAFAEFSRSLLRGSWPRCTAAAREAGSEPVVLKPAVSCGECVLQGVHRDRTAAVVQLRHGGSCVGFLGVSLPEGSMLDDEERQLLLEIAGDVAFARQSAEIRRLKEESEARYELLFENSPAGIAVSRILHGPGGHPVDYRVMNANPAFERNTGLRLKDVVGSRFSELFGPPARDELLAGCAGVATTGEPATFSVIVRESGRHLSVNAHRVGADGLAVMVTDVSEAVRHREEREDFEERLRLTQRMEAVGRLAGGVAHDFNNMLSVILGHGARLAEGLPAEHPLREAAVEVVEAGKRSAALTRQLLAFNRQTKLKPEVLDLREVLEGMKRLLGTLLGEDIELVFDLDRDVAPVEVDRSQLEQVVMNLAVNARDAMPTGGELRLETRNAGGGIRGLGPLGPGGEDEYVALVVRDTGVGMDQDTLDHVFEPFFTTKERGKGTGLGLSTVYGIVKQSGGDISVRSERGSGTEFVVYFPSSAGTASPAERALAERGPAPTGSGKVLVVDDEPALRLLFERTLAGRGYEVWVASGGGEAIHLVEEQGLRPDVLVTDMMMPGMGGKELAERIRSRVPGLRVVFMSGHTDDVVGERAGGLDEPFIQKPFETSVLARVIGEVLGRG